jgi:hypothetical protein
MDILKRLRMERNELVRKAQHARREAAQRSKHIAVIQKIERGIKRGQTTAKRGKHELSRKARLAISRAQKARWAKVRVAKS